MATPKACTVECSSNISLNIYEIVVKTSQSILTPNSQPSRMVTQRCPKEDCKDYRLHALGVLRWTRKMARTDRCRTLHHRLLRGCKCWPYHQFPFSSTEKTLSQEFSRSPPKCLRASKTETGAHQGRYEESPSQEGHANKHHRKDTKGRPLKVLSPTMQKIFGDFDGHVSIQRSPPRWVMPKFVERAAKFVRSLK